MKLLLDSHILLWMAGDPDKLSLKVRNLVENPDTRLFFSTATAWELVIKESLKKLRSPKKVLSIIAQAEREFSLARLDILDSHLKKLSYLPFHHRDPFDRLLAAQVLTEKLVLVSNDSIFDKYGVDRI